MDFALWLGLCGLALGLSILGLRLLVLVTRINLVLFLSLKAGSQAAMNCFSRKSYFANCSAGALRCLAYLHSDIMASTVPSYTLNQQSIVLLAIAVTAWGFWTCYDVMAAMYHPNRCEANEQNKTRVLDFDIHLYRPP